MVPSKIPPLFVFYLGGDVPGFRFHQPGASHEARFMADASYILTLRMTQRIRNVLNEEEKNLLKHAAFFISVCYAPWFLKSYVVEKSPFNDLAAIKSAFQIKDHYPKLGQALLASMQRHNLYLSEQLVVLALAETMFKRRVR
jgi:uroporphyrinogen-III decarboxylase